MPPDNGSQESNELAELIGPFYSWGRCLDVLGVDDAHLSTLVRAGLVVMAPSLEGIPLFPKFQFVPGADRVWPGVSAVSSVLASCDAWAVALLLVTPAPEFGGSTPLQVAVTGGREDELDAFARHVRSEWR